MTLELSKLIRQVKVMGEELAAREKEHVSLIELAREWLVQYADQAEALQGPAREYRAAIPCGEPLDSIHPLPSAPERFTFVAADGSEIQPDPHGAALYYLINVGSMVYRHGSGETPAAHSQPTVKFDEADLYEGWRLVQGNLLDVRRDLAEIARLADLCAQEPPDCPTLAVVDGTLVLWALQDTQGSDRKERIDEYLDRLDVIRDSGATVAAFISRPRREEVTRLLYLASTGDPKQAKPEKNPLRHVPDRAVFESLLPAGARSALFGSPSEVNTVYYQPRGHEIRLFYLNVAEEGRDPVVARVEVPAWVTEDGKKLALAHAGIVAQARITGDYPYALARADELAFVSGPEREALDDMVFQSLLRAGGRAGLSPKQYYKTQTRRGRRRYL